MNVRKLAARSLAGALGLLLALSLVLVPAPVLAVPQMGHIFYGDVTSDGEPLPPEVIAEGVSVVAKINGDVYASTTVDADSKYGWETPFEVPADDPDTPEKEGGVNDETIEFYVEGVLADTFAFEIGGRDEFPLEVDITPPSAPNAELMTVNQNPPETLDSVEGTAGAVEASAMVEVWDDETAREAENLICDVLAGEFGSFDEIAIGDNLYGTVWITAKDAEDNRSDATEMANDIVGPAFVSVAVSDPDEFYKAGDTISFDVDLGEAGLTVTADLTVLDSALASDFALTDDEDDTYSGTTSALSSETMVEGLDTAVTLTATDAAGNPTTDDSLTLTIDKTAPVISATSPATDADIKAGFTVDYTLDEAVASGTIAFTATEPAGTTQTYALVSGDFASGAHTIAEADLTGVTLADGTVYSINFDATDPAGNPAFTVTNTGITYDTGAPTVTIDIPDYINAANEAAVPVTITSNEGGTYSYTISDGTTDVTGGGSITAGFDVDLTPDLSGLGEGSVTADASVEDTAGNTGVATHTATKDTGAPTVTITSTASDPTSTSPIPMTATFTEDVTGFEVGDITVTNGTAGSFAGSGADYTFDVTPAADGEVTVNIAADAAEDTATNGNEASPEFSITYSPSGVVVTIDAVTSPTNTATQTLTGTMSEGATVTLTADTTATFGAVTYPTITTWSCNVTLVEGSNGITATADTSTATATIVLDTAAPTVVSKSPAAGAPGVAVGITVSVTFSEAMDASTITTSSFSLDSVSGSVSYSSGTYTATFTPSDNLTLDTTYTANLSTAITDAVGNPLEAYSWSFTTATASLGDLIDDTESGGTLDLPAGTYTGGTIDKPMTITGTDGTIISGGIHVAPLTGSEFTIENVTITDYTDYGIWIELVGADDVFTIRNNTIEGVEGSLIGIQVDEVEADGILDIKQNSISGNEIGVKLLEDVVDGAINFNNIVDNEVGLELLRLDHSVGASMNWWGDISGPEEENSNPGGTGDKIEPLGGMGYEPWLTREFQTVLDDNIAYFGYAWVRLETGWNIVSTPIALDPLVEWVDSEGTSRTGVNTWGDYKTLGDGLDVHATSPAYRFNSQTQLWVALTSDSPLKPCDAIYVRMAADDIAAILYSPHVSVPSKELYSGWNLISPAWIEGAGMPANEVLVTVEEVTGELTGYKLVVSPGVNWYESPWIYIAGDSIEPWTDPELPPPDSWMMQTSGYWVFMLNDGTLAGFTFTPVSLGM